MKTERPARWLTLHPLVVCAALLGGPPHAFGQSIYRTVKYFGQAEFSLNSPTGGLVEGTNGALYGMTFFGGATGNGTVFKLNRDGSGVLVVKGFSTGTDARLPVGTLLLANNGMLYGACSSGGVSNLGAIFRLNQDGSSYSILKSFTGDNGDGATPVAGLVQTTNGAFYGTTYAGGTSNLGTVFTISRDGLDYSVLRSFTGGATDGANPRASLIQGIDGVLYGTTMRGGSQNQGTIFKLNSDGSGYQVIKSFGGGANDGAQPYAALIQPGDGMGDVLFGTTYAGGASSKGTLYRILPDGSGFQVLKSFGGTSGASLVTPVIFGTNGALYGTTSAGGTSTNGTMFEIGPDGTGFRVLQSYSADGAQGVQPNGPLLQASDGMLYGTTARGGRFGQGTAFDVNPETGAYSVLQDFTETGGDGVNPYGDLIEGLDGALYGVTQYGGASDQGTVYKVNKDGSGSMVLKSFTGTSADGCRPSAGLAQGADGLLYGTAMYDSTYQSGSSTLVRGYGHVFKLQSDGNGYQMLRQFSGAPDGANPYGMLLLANNGAIYGTTMGGGSKSVGTVFRLNPDGASYSVVKSFQDTGATDGARPYAGLIQGTNGVLYGTTSIGGSGSKGAVFKLNLDGTGYGLLKSFAGSDGATPWAPLLEGQDGALYGTTAAGGANNKGTIFKLNADGTGFTVLKSFNGLDGAGPMAGLTQAPNGVLFGTTTSGGAVDLMQSVGTVFQLNPDGSGFRVLKTFPQNGDGILPKSGVLLGGDGTLYGATFNGGRGGNLYGTVFSLVPAPVVLAQVLETGGCQLRVVALSGRSYMVERASSIAGPWTSLGTVNVGSTGIGQFSDPTPPSNSAFYRTSYP
ncbi:MAG TPA: choice-of-anchor tandem repeat GloVer-containing protein [Verrucomicrobiae bacterium]